MSLKCSLGTNLFPATFLWLSWPEEVWADCHSSALVWFLEQSGWCQRTLCPQRFMVLLPKTRHPLKRANDQCDCSQLRLAVTDLILVQRKCLDKTLQVMHSDHQVATLKKHHSFEIVYLETMETSSSLVTWIHRQHSRSSQSVFPRLLMPPVGRVWVVLLPALLWWGLQ